MRALGLTVRRVAAYLVDVVVLAVVLLPVAFGIGSALGTQGLGGFDVWLRAVLLVSLPAWAYFIVTDRFGGRSVGKRLIGLRTVEPDGGSPSWTRAIVRTAVKLAPWELVHLAFFGLSASFTEFSMLQIVLAGLAYALMAAYVIVPLFSGGRRGVQDLLADTRVVPA
jgi:uncharacterized RDD family membrane protein YckC